MSNIFKSKKVMSKTDIEMLISPKVAFMQIVEGMLDETLDDKGFFHELTLTVRNDNVYNKEIELTVIK